MPNKMPIAYADIIRYVSLIKEVDLIFCRAEAQAEDHYFVPAALRVFFLNQNWRNRIFCLDVHAAHFMFSIPMMIWFICIRSN